MNILETIKSAFSSVLSNKMRTLLTMLGIIIGIGSVIMITSIGQGSQSKITGEFDKLGAGRLDISLKDRTDFNPNHMLSVDDVNILKSHPEVNYVAPIVVSPMSKIRLKNPKDDKNCMVIGITGEGRFLYQFELVAGRLIMDADNKSKSNVAVINDSVAKKVFGSTDVVGQKILIKTYRGTFKPTIIGIIKDPYAALGSLIGADIPTEVYMPLEVTKQHFGIDYLEQISVIVKDPNTMESVGKQLVAMLDRKHRTEDTYRANSVMKNLDQFNQILGVITAFISFVAGISLVVGGVGVMNIMLVTVTERTREIGIRKSLGAKNRDILLQFLIESVILTFIGGLIGILLGYLGGYGVGKFMKITPVLSPLIIMLAFTISSGIGIVFGVYPANKASKLDPIEALRYE